MKISIYNNVKNDVVTITSCYNEIKKVEKNDNITVLYNADDKVVGVNVFKSGIDTVGYLNISDIDSKYLDLFETEVKPSFVYGEIVSLEKHPKSDKLKICQVNLGFETVQIVCGASNCEEGNIAIVATVGAVMNNGMKILESSLINVESNGMLCSLKELGKLDSTDVGIKLFDLGSKVIGSEVMKEDLI